MQWFENWTETCTIKWLTPWTQDLNWTYIRRLEDTQGVLWTSYVRSIYVLYPGGRLNQTELQTDLTKWDLTNKYVVFWKDDNKLYLI